MFFGKRELPQPKIKAGKWLWRKEDGQLQWVTGLFFCLFLGILLMTQLQVESYRATAMYLEDALAASNLASALIDLEEYGISHRILIDNPQAAYEKYCEAVKENLQLNEQWESDNSSLISGPVRVENYTIYNVWENVVTITSVTGDGEVSTLQGMLGVVRAPNHILIENTGIYSELSFPVEGSFGVTITARKGKLVDVVAEAE